MGWRPAMYSPWLQATGVVADQPGVGLGLELTDRGEVAAMEGPVTPTLDQES